MNESDYRDLMELRRKYNDLLADLKSRVKFNIALSRDTSAMRSTNTAAWYCAEELNRCLAAVGEGVDE